MKRFLAFFLAIQITALLLSGCSIPFFGRSDGEKDKSVNALDMIGIDDNTEGNGSKAAAGGKSGTISGNQHPGAALQENISDNGSDSSTYTAGQNNGYTGSVNDSVSAGLAGPDGSDDRAGVAGSAYTDTGADSGDSTGTASTGSYADSWYSSGNSENPESASSVSNGTGVLGVKKVQADAISEPRRPVTVYYQDDDGCIIPMTRWIQPQLGIARAAVSLAIDSPVAREETAYYGVYPILPEGTEILGIDIKNGVAVIDFNRNLLNYGTAYSERNIVAAVVYTLTEFDTIEKVKILINGYTPGLLKYGTDLSEPIGREDLMINANLSKLPAGKEKLDIYYLKKANDSFTYPVPVSVTIEGRQTDSLPGMLITKMLAYKPEGGIYSEVPEGAYLNASYVRNGVLTLDFNGKFLSYQGTAREEAILKQLAYTLRQCGGITKVNIMIDGRSVDLPGGTNVSAGLAIPVTINDVMDRG